MQIQIKLLLLYIVVVIPLQLPSTDCQKKKEKKFRHEFDKKGGKKRGKKQKKNLRKGRKYKQMSHVDFKFVRQMDFPLMKYCSDLLLESFKSGI